MIAVIDETNFKWMEFLNKDLAKLRAISKIKNIEANSHPYTAKNSSGFHIETLVEPLIPNKSLGLSHSEMLRLSLIS